MSSMRGIVDSTRRLEAAWDAQEAHGIPTHRTDPEVLTEAEREKRARLEWAHFHRCWETEVTG